MQIIKLQKHIDKYLKLHKKKHFNKIAIQYNNKQYSIEEMEPEFEQLCRNHYWINISCLGIKDEVMYFEIFDLSRDGPTPDNRFTWDGKEAFADVLINGPWSNKDIIEGKVFKNMKIYLRDKNKAIVEAWKQEFGNTVEISCGDIFGINAEAIISPGNSFGRMDGGIDYYYSKYFGWDLQDRLQEKLAKEYSGELPVGQAVIIPTNNKTIKYLIACPTMRVPQDVSKTNNAYLAFKAGLKIALKNNITSVLCPGLGTLTGKITPENCAKQMKKAYDEVFGMGEQSFIKKLGKELL